MITASYNAFNISQLQIGRKILLRDASKAMHLMSFRLSDGEINRLDEIYVWAFFKKEKNREANR